MDSVIDTRNVRIKKELSVVSIDSNSRSSIRMNRIKDYGKSQTKREDVVIDLQLKSRKRQSGVMQSIDILKRDNNENRFRQKRTMGKQTNMLSHKYSHEGNMMRNKQSMTVNEQDGQYKRQDQFSFRERRPINSSFVFNSLAQIKQKYMTNYQKK